MATMSEFVELQAENERLDAECEKWEMENDALLARLAEFSAEVERLQAEVARLSSPPEPEARHTLDCDMVKHRNCTRCNCGSSIDPRIESLSGGNPSEKSASGPADHRGIVAARSSEGGNVGKIADVSIRSREPVDSNPVSGGAGEFEALRASSDDPAQSVRSAPPPRAVTDEHIDALFQALDIYDSTPEHEYRSIVRRWLGMTDPPPRALPLDSNVQTAPLPPITFGLLDRFEGMKLLELGDQDELRWSQAAIDFAALVRTEATPPDDDARDAARWRMLMKLDCMSVSYYGLPDSECEKRTYGGHWESELEPEQITAEVDKLIAVRAASTKASEQ